MTTQQTPDKKVRPKTMLLIDAYNLIYRAYHASLIPQEVQEEQEVDGELKNVMVKKRVSSSYTKSGMPTNAIYTVGMMLKKLRKEFPNPGYCLAVFDGGGDNFRKELDEEYKANRASMPEELKAQMPYIEKMFELMGFPITRPRGVEADDVIGALAKRAGDAGYKVDIISRDKDFRQIASDTVRVHDTLADVIYDRAMVIQENGVPPEKIVDYLALTGDGVDNVKGVDKCGPKTAVKWINEYGDLDGIIKNADKITGVVGANLKKSIADGSLELARKLVTINLDVEMNYKNSDMTIRDVNKGLFDDFCGDLGLYRLQYHKPTPEEMERFNTEANEAAKERSSFRPR